MKTGIVTTLIALCLPVSVFATTLRLSTDVAGFFGLYLAAISAYSNL
ncbi:hypothetical protein ABJ785_002781 [Escherichia coli]